jgi:hypothetical protein
MRGTSLPPWKYYQYGGWGECPASLADHHAALFSPLDRRWLQRDASTPMSLIEPRQRTLSLAANGDYWSETNNRPS